MVHFMRLEPRIMLDAVGLAADFDADHVPDDGGADIPGHFPAQFGELLNADGDQSPFDLEKPGAARGLFFVDTGVPDRGAIMEKARSKGFEAVAIPEGSDGVRFVAETLGRFSDLPAIHIFSHGAPGTIRLGDASLSTDSLAGYSQALRAWGEALEPGGDILLYGCRAGLAPDFIAGMAEMTGADVAASDDVTGGADQNGDWILEVRDGDVKTGAVSFDEWGHALLFDVYFTSPSTAEKAENHTGNALNVGSDISNLPGIFSRSYSIVGGTDADSFTINNSGNLRFKSPPDYDAPWQNEGKNVYQVQVKARYTFSIGIGIAKVDYVKSGTQTINVTVTDVNEPVEITSAESLNATEGVAALPITVADPENGPFTYTITGGADQAKFRSDANGLYFISPPSYRGLGDANSDNVYEVSYTVSDGEFSDSQDVKAAVVDVNSAPSFTGASSFSVSENASFAASVTATDPDGGILLYSVTGGADQNLFEIGRTSGALTFKTPPDYENPDDQGSDRSYEVEVTVSDRRLSATRTLTISVTDVNEAPVFNGAASAAAVENSTSGPTVSASDPEGAALTYSVTGGADQDKFSIDAGSGALTFLSPPDYESPSDAGANNVYEIQITAGDGVVSENRTVYVSVSSVNEFAPEVTSPDSVSLYRGESFVMTAASRDPDDDPATWSITGGADRDLFSIDANSGRLAFLSTPNYANPLDADGNNVYEVEITASDGAFSGSKTIEAIVTSVDKPVPEVKAPPIVRPDSGSRQAGPAGPAGALGVLGQTQDASGFSLNVPAPDSPGGVGPVGEGLSAIANRLDLDLISDSGATLGRIQAAAGFMGGGPAPESGNAVFESLLGDVTGFDVQTSVEDDPDAWEIFQ
ncbi:hypothetical protein EPICR_140033 [Candidatus Desulfarcum epimagneticum]|uniref:Cadherin domain-containing protein n=1 Tax=uncultured Desulfobacteraceae bacterium TaxID=218296 RepID=A0A484HI65_9BACT|nr:hypothetical protein EPICR_140033 [uncultured Desulfobacteraceae bacterium]